MALAKRVVLFLAVNFLVVTVISFLIYLFGLQGFLTSQGLNYQSLAIFCLIWGMGGSFISLALSKTIAKWSMGVQIIDPNAADPALRDLVEMVHSLSTKAGLPSFPEVGVFPSPEVNAFATGATKARSLVAVSSGMLQRMKREEIEAVLGHEISHVANGDMVTMTLLQGVVNAFVMFLARIVAFAISRLVTRDDRENGLSPFVFQMTVFGLEMVFMVLGMLVVAAFSRFREFRADEGGARLAGREKMVQALQALQRTLEIRDARVDQPAYQALKISSPQGFSRFFATHPPLEIRIARLRGNQ